MIRKIIAVIAGYFVFVVTSIALFYFTGQDAHAAATLGFKIITLVFGAFFSVLSGYVVQLIAQSGNLKTNYALALLIAGFAIFSYFKTSGEHWTQLMAIFIFAPVSIVGGYLKLKAKN